MISVCVSEPLDILEIGSETGKNTEYLLTKAKHLPGADFSAEMLSRAEGKIMAENVEFRQFDLREVWNFAENLFDLITCSRLNILKILILSLDKRVRFDAQMVIFISANSIRSSNIREVKRGLRLNREFLNSNVLSITFRNSLKRQNAIALIASNFKNGLTIMIRRKFRVF